jgi:hypothetical protein
MGFIKTAIYAIFVSKKVKDAAILVELEKLNKTKKKKK